MILATWLHEFKTCDLSWALLRRNEGINKEDSPIVGAVSVTRQCEFYYFPLFNEPVHNHICRDVTIWAWHTDNMINPKVVSVMKVEVRSVLPTTFQLLWIQSTPIYSSSEQSDSGRVGSIRLLKDRLKVTSFEITGANLVADGCPIRTTEGSF